MYVQPAHAAPGLPDCARDEQPRFTSEKRTHFSHFYRLNTRYVALHQKSQKKTKKRAQKGKLLKKGQKKGKLILKKGKSYF